MSDPITWFGGKIRLEGFGHFPRDFLEVKRKMIGNYVREILKSERGFYFDRLTLRCEDSPSKDECMISVFLDFQDKSIGFSKEGENVFDTLDSVLKELKNAVIPEVLGDEPKIRKGVQMTMSGERVGSKDD